MLAPSDLDTKITRHSARRELYTDRTQHEEYSTRDPRTLHHDWFAKTDPNGQKVSVWAKKVPKDPYPCHRILCNAPFTIAKGFGGIQQHARTDKHKSNKCKADENQTVLIPSAVTTDDAPDGSTVSQPVGNQGKDNPIMISLFSQDDVATRAELIYTMNVVVKGHSTHSCQDVKELLQAMFPGCIPDAFPLSPAELSYLINHALGPYFQKELLSDLHVPNTALVLQFDEFSNSKHKEELQVRISYWS
ncbi:hypothetical protein QAD02_003085 [Eretmocerus hayati]|uniref:Uncharacterized protein n=1 Tax=Eretmocerus hayati TaxID=131215 RepID=A0ACC2NL49_9HYME|nr:hypothetical protein QAD02_003085 [Eretmocerus hayati]